MKDWKGGKLIDDGAFIYDTTAKSLGGQDYDGFLFRKSTYCSHRLVRLSVVLSVRRVMTS